jgi:proteasome lid subunit RPN8/RPN11
MPRLTQPELASSAREGLAMDDILEKDFTPLFQVTLSRLVADQIRNSIPRASPNERANLGLAFSKFEVGGMLMGERIGQNAARVTAVSLALGELHGFHRDPAEHDPCVAEFLCRFPDRKRYGLIGSWHSHPSGTLTLSPRDLQSLRAELDSPVWNLLFMVMLIVSLGSNERLDAEGLVVLLRMPKVRSKIVVTIENEPRQLEADPP